MLSAWWKHAPLFSHLVKEEGAYYGIFKEDRFSRKTLFSQRCIKTAMHDLKSMVPGKMTAFTSTVFHMPYFNPDWVLLWQLMSEQNEQEERNTAGTDVTCLSFRIWKKQARALRGEITLLPYSSGHGLGSSFKPRYSHYKWMRTSMVLCHPFIFFCLHSGLLALLQQL